jgi:molybdenum cofactor cytidylyltransferase
VRFGPLPLAEAEGAILAHTLRLPGGPVLKKGRALSADDLAKLAAAGRSEVVAAKLEAGDVHEDAAAAALARALTGPGLRAGEAFTGRCNLFADAHGVLVVDRDGIDRVNAVDESLTVATLEPFAVVQPRELAVTVKIIPFAVRPEALEGGLAAARGAEPLVRVAKLRPAGAGLILTQTPGLAASVLERAAESQRTRMARLGGSVREELRCAHDEAAVADAIGALRASGCDPILILGASAIVDRRDVIPRAIERAGGAVLHLGMPVDPGNLLLLARHGATAVIGLPGCARSLEPSGADRVLARVLAGLPVGGRDLQRMGAGGLLQEARSRPQPREPEAAPAALRVGAVLLAAGLSRRMGAANKLLAEVDGAPMVARCADAVLASPARPLVVVTGHEAARVRAALAGRELVFAHNPEAAAGLSASLRAGIAALGDKVDGALVCLGDMPWVRTEHIEALIAAFEASGGRSICVPTFDRKRGNPVLWPARHFAEIAALGGDAGARALLDAHAGEVCYVPVADAGVTLDVDTPEALAALLEAEEEPA